MLSIAIQDLCFKSHSDPNLMNCCYSIALVLFFLSHLLFCVPFACQECWIFDLMLLHFRINGVDIRRRKKPIKQCNAPPTFSLGPYDVPRSNCAVVGVPLLPFDLTT